MTKNELIAKIDDLEWEDFEVKEAKSALPKSSWETVSAFSNTNGGWLVFGVKQNGKKLNLQGINNPEKIEQDFLNTLRGEKFNVFIATKQTKYDVDGCTILCFYIPISAQKPVYFNNVANTFIRRGSSDQRATKSEIDAMYRDQSFGTKTSEIAPDSDPTCIDERSLKQYRVYMARFNPDVAYSRYDSEEFLRKMRVVENGACTYGGLLFLGKRECVERYFPDFRIDLLEVPGSSYSDAKSRYTFRLDEHENLWQYYFECFTRLKRGIDIDFKVSGEGFGEELSPGMMAIREVLINMLMHADYFATSHSRIRIFYNHIEFYNPGGLPKPLEELKQKDLSLPRNPIITKLFRMVRLAENAGFGFDKIESNWNTYNHTVPEYILDFDSVIIKLDITEKKVIHTDMHEILEQLRSNFGATSDYLDRKDKAENIEHLKSIYGVFTGYLRGIYGVNIEDLCNKHNDRMAWILMLVTLSPEITRQEIATILGKSLSTIEKDIYKLRKENIINRKGADKTGRWIILHQKNVND